GSSPERSAAHAQPPFVRARFPSPRAAPAGSSRKWSLLQFLLSFMEPSDGSFQAPDHEGLGLRRELLMGQAHAHVELDLLDLVDCGEHVLHEVGLPLHVLLLAMLHANDHLSLDLAVAALAIRLLDPHLSTRCLLPEIRSFTLHSLSRSNRVRVNT